MGGNSVSFLFKITEFWICFFFNKSRFWRFRLRVYIHKFTKKKRYIKSDVLFFILATYLFFVPI